MDNKVQGIETQVQENKKLIDEINKNAQTHQANQTQINQTLLQMQKTQAEQLAKQTPDPSQTYQRNQLLQDVQREGCVLTIQNSTVTDSGTAGWNQILDNLRFRQNFMKEPFNTGVLKNINLPGGKQMSTVTFSTRYQCDLFYKAVEKRDQPLKFFFSYQVQYRAANKLFRARAVLLRELGMNTDISIDESSLIMYLKYREKSEGRTPYEYEINSKFDPFDKSDENSLATKTGKKLNMSSILIKPRYGDVYTTQVLTGHL